MPVLLLLLAPGVPRICSAVNATRPLGAGGWKSGPVLPNGTGEVARRDHGKRAKHSRRRGKRGSRSCGWAARASGRPTPVAHLPSVPPMIAVRLLGSAGVCWGFAGVPACGENSGPITSPIAVMEAARLAGGRVNRAPQRPTSSLCRAIHHAASAQTTTPSRSPRAPNTPSQGYTTLHQPKIVRTCCSSPPIHPVRPWKTLGKTLSGSGSVPTLVRVSSVVCLFMLELPDSSHPDR